MNLMRMQNIHCLETFLGNMQSIIDPVTALEYEACIHIIFHSSILVQHKDGPS